MGIPIQDEKARSSHVYGVTYFDGSQLTINNTPGQETTTWKHKTGSSIKFLPDGSISIIAVKDLMLLAGGKGNGKKSHMVFGGDCYLEFRKNLNIVANEEVNFQIAKAYRRHSDVSKVTTVKEYVLNVEAYTCECTNRHYVNTNALDVDAKGAGIWNFKGMWNTTSETGLGYKNTNEKGGVYIESQGEMNVNVVKNYNTTVTDGNINVSGAKNCKVEIAKTLDVDAKMIYLN
tara:strand:- start:7430 stop:8125 length:696 start_codon:yes stop_codon:yes gene_type:complete